MARQFSSQRFRELRQEAGISIERLAIAIDRSAYSIQEYQRGRVTPPITVIAAIADAIGRPIEDLLAEDQPRERAA